MTIPSELTTRISEIGNGSKTVFEFKFKIFNKNDLKVYKVTNATGAQVLQTVDVDYTVAINGTDNDLSTQGGMITYTVAPTTAESSLILADYPLSQNNNLSTRSDFPEQTIEGIYDKLALINNTFSEELGRTAKAPVGSSINDLKTDLPSAGKMIVWNADGTALKNTDVTVQDFIDGNISLYNEVSEDTVDNSSTTSTAYDFQVLSSVTDSITPKSTANGVLLLITIITAPDQSEAPVYYRIKRDGTALHNCSASDAGSRVRVTGAVECNNSNSLTNRPYFFAWIDEPASISSVTYTVEWAVNSGISRTWYNNKQRFDPNSAAGLRTSSNISLIELKNVL